MSVSVVRTLKSRSLHYITLDIRGHFSQLAINGWDDETTKTIVKSTECTTATVNTTNSTAITRTWWAMKGGNLIENLFCVYLFLGKTMFAKASPFVEKNWINSINQFGFSCSTINKRYHLDIIIQTTNNYVQNGLERSKRNKKGQVKNNKIS